MKFEGANGGGVTEKRFFGAARGVYDPPLKPKRRPQNHEQVPGRRSA